MLSISHAATGAFLAAKLQHPLLYIPATLASHYLEDYVLHWDVGTGLSNGSRKRWHAFVLELVDLGVTTVFVLAMYPITPWRAFQDASAGQWTALAPYLGAFFGLLPDFVEAPRNFFRWNPWFLRPFNAFHHAVHHSTPNILLGLTPQLVLLGLLWFFR